MQHSVQALLVLGVFQKDLGLEDTAAVRTALAKAVAQIVPQLELGIQ